MNSQIDDDWITISEEEVTGYETIDGGFSERDNLKISNSNTHFEIQHPISSILSQLKPFDIEFDFCLPSIEFIWEDDVKNGATSNIVVKTSPSSKLSFLIDKEYFVAQSNLLKKELTVRHTNCIIINYTTNLNLSEFLQWIMDDVNPLKPANVRDYLQLAIQLGMMDRTEDCVEFWTKLLSIFLNRMFNHETETFKTHIISKSSLWGPYPFMFYIIQDYFTQSYNNLLNNYQSQYQEEISSQSHILLMPILLHSIKGNQRSNSP